MRAAPGAAARSAGGWSVEIVRSKRSTSPPTRTPTTPRPRSPAPRPERPRGLPRRATGARDDGVDQALVAADHVAHRLAPRAALRAPMTSGACAPRDRWRAAPRGGASKRESSSGARFGPRAPGRSAGAATSRAEGRRDRRSSFAAGTARRTTPGAGAGRRQGREAQQVGDAVEVVHLAVDEEPGADRRKAQLVLEAELLASPIMRASAGVITW